MIDDPRAPPTQDPSALTAIAVNALRDEVHRDTAALKELLSAESRHLQELHGERFRSIEQQFESVQTQLRERDTRVETSGRDNKLAIDAALQAAEKAVGKSESGFTKQIDEMGRTTSAVTGGMNKEIDDMKRRLGAIEGRTAGVGMSAGVIAQIIASVGVVVGVAVLLLRH